MDSDAVIVVSFSGIDGAGKSTQITQLRQYLDQLGLRIKLYTFWDDVVAFSTLREGLSLSLFKGDKGVGSPDRPIVRRDKNVNSGFVVAFRLLLYSFDLLRLRMIAHQAAACDADVVIFDRYIYDELANLPCDRWLIRLYTKLLLKLTPKPDLAFLVDAVPEVACARKPEYPIEFVRRNREAYLKLARAAEMTILPAGSIEEAEAEVRSSISSMFSRGPRTNLRTPFECAAPDNSASGTTG